MLDSACSSIHGGHGQAVCGGQRNHKIFYGEMRNFAKSSGLK